MTANEKSAKNKTAIRYEVFAREYVLDLNGTRAAIAAGYSEKGADSKASQLLGNVKVQKLITDLVEKRAKKLDLTADKVLGELCRMGFANMLDYIKTNDEGDAYVDLSRMTREQAAAVQEITVDEYTEGRGKAARNVKRTRIKLSDKGANLERLGRYLSMFTDRVESSGPGGGPIPVNVPLDEISTQQLEQLIGRKLKEAPKTANET